jgi:hypothetical protein
MCLLGIAFQIDGNCPVLVLANREESFFRPTAGPRIHPPHGGAPPWLGGTDLLAGGTWLGVNPHGLLVAITNRPRANIPATPRSRGLLCRSLLAYRNTQSAVRSAVEQLRQGVFAGCNLLIATPTEAAVIEFADDLGVTPLSPGLHLVTNGPLNDPADRRITRVRRELATPAPGNPAEWMLRARQVCAQGAEGEQPAICLAGKDRGTISSTVLSLARPIEDSQYWHARKSPAEVAYDDLSPLLGTLLTAPAHATGGHRIRLRGPWRYEPLAHARPDGALGIGRSSESLPAAGTARFPATWEELLGEFRGRVSFRRRFHRPNNLEPDERVFVVLENVALTGAVSVNGQSLGALDPRTRGFSADVTDLLSGNDELHIELEWTGETSEQAGVPLWTTAAIEIRSTHAGPSRGAR